MSSAAPPTAVGAAAASPSPSSLLLQVNARHFVVLPEALQQRLCERRGLRLRRRTTSHSQSVSHSISHSSITSTSPSSRTLDLWDIERLGEKEVGRKVTRQWYVLRDSAAANPPADVVDVARLLRETHLGKDTQQAAAAVASDEKNNDDLNNVEKKQRIEVLRCHLNDREREPFVHFVDVLNSNSSSSSSHPLSIREGDNSFLFPKYEDSEVDSLYLKRVLSATHLVGDTLSSQTLLHHKHLLTALQFISQQTPPSAPLLFPKLVYREFDRFMNEPFNGLGENRFIVEILVNKRVRVISTIVRSNDDGVHCFLGVLSEVKEEKQHFVIEALLPLFDQNAAATSTQLEHSTNSLSSLCVLELTSPSCSTTPREELVELARAMKRSPYYVNSLTFCKDAGPRPTLSMVLAVYLVHYPHAAGIDILNLQGFVSLIKWLSRDRLAITAAIEDFGESVFLVSAQDLPSSLTSNENLPLNELIQVENTKLFIFSVITQSRTQDIAAAAAAPAPAPAPEVISKQSNLSETETIPDAICKTSTSSIDNGNSCEKRPRSLSPSFQVVDLSGDSTETDQIPDKRKCVRRDDDSHSTRYKSVIDESNSKETNLEAEHHKTEQELVCDDDDDDDDDDEEELVSSDEKDSCSSSMHVIQPPQKILNTSTTSETALPPITYEFIEAVANMCHFAPDDKDIETMLLNEYNHILDRQWAELDFNLQLMKLGISTVLPGLFAAHGASAVLSEALCKVVFLLSRKRLPTEQLDKTFSGFRKSLSDVNIAACLLKTIETHSSCESTLDAAFKTLLLFVDSWVNSQKNAPWTNFFAVVVQLLRNGPARKELTEMIVTAVHCMVSKIPSATEDIYNMVFCLLNLINRSSSHSLEGMDKTILSILRAVFERFPVVRGKCCGDKALVHLLIQIGKQQRWKVSLTLFFTLITSKVITNKDQLTLLQQHVGIARSHLQGVATSASSEPLSEQAANSEVSTTEKCFVELFNFVKLSQGQPVLWEQFIELFTMLAGPVLPGSTRLLFMKPASHSTFIKTFCKWLTPKMLAALSTSTIERLYDSLIHEVARFNNMDSNGSAPKSLLVKLIGTLLFHSSELCRRPCDAMVYDVLLQILSTASNDELVYNTIVSIVNMCSEQANNLHARQIIKRNIPFHLVVRFAQSSTKKNTRETACTACVLLVEHMTPIEKQKFRGLFESNRLHRAFVFILTESIPQPKNKISKVSEDSLLHFHHFIIAILRLLNVFLEDPPSVISPLREAQALQLGNLHLFHEAQGLQLVMKCMQLLTALPSPHKKYGKRLTSESIREGMNCLYWYVNVSSETIAARYRQELVQELNVGDVLVVFIDAWISDSILVETILRIVTATATGSSENKSQLALAGIFSKLILVIEKYSGFNQQVGSQAAIDEPLINDALISIEKLIDVPDVKLLLFDLKFHDLLCFLLTLSGLYTSENIAPTILKNVLILFHLQDVKQLNNSSTFSKQVLLELGALRHGFDIATRLKSVPSQRSIIDRWLKLAASVKGEDAWETFFVGSSLESDAARGGLSLVVTMYEHCAFANSRKLLLGAVLKLVVEYRDGRLKLQGSGMADLIQSICSMPFTQNDIPQMEIIEIAKKINVILL